MRKFWFVLFASMLTFSAFSATYSNGNQYTTLDKPITNQPRVLEFFSFFCPHCYQFENVYHVSSMLNKSFPPGIKEVKYHVDFMGGKLGQLITHAWSVAMALNVEDKVLVPLFDGIQNTQTIRDEQSLKQTFIQAANISADVYDAAWNSFAVKAMVLKQQKAAADFKLSAVPMLFVDGKYTINMSKLDSSSEQNFIADYVNLVNYLLKK